MKLIAGVVLMLVNVRFTHSCVGEGLILFCTEIPPAFSPGYSSLVMSLRDVGEMDSAVLRSDGLSSVTRLRIEGSGVTGIAEGAFSSFQNLTNLSLQKNLLTEMNPNWLSRPDVLRELSLAENQLEVVNESTLNGLSNLVRLSLSKNKITTIGLNSFSSNTMLAELDLSENMMTRVSPQVFRSLRSTGIRLDGNPWDCSCGAEDFVDFLKDLRSRPRLDGEMEVTCASPPSLRGQPVLDVSVCANSPPPTSAQVLTSPPSRPPAETKTSVQPTDAPTVMSSHIAAPPSRPAETKTSVQPTPTTVTTPALKTATYVTSPTSPPSVTEISVRPKPSDLSRTISPPTETCATSRPSSDANLIWTLVVVIAVLSSLLFVACFLAVPHGRKRNNKAVTPGRPEDDRKELKEDNRSSRAQSPGHSEKRENDERDPETGWRRSFTGLRAKSANAILFMSPFCAPVKDQVTLQTETDAQTEGKQKLGDETEADGGIETKNLTNAADAIKNAKGADAGRNLDKNPHCVPANTDTVPYLSIGTIQNKPSPADFTKRSTDASQRSQMGKVMGRISTWPPTAVQWQARCKMKEGEGEGGSDVFTEWTPTFPGEAKKVLKKDEHPSASDRDKNEDGIEKSQLEDPLKMTVADMTFGLSQCSEPNDKTTSLHEDLSHIDTRLEEQLKEEVRQDPANVRQTQNLTQSPNQDPKSAESLAHKNTKKSSNKAEQRSEPARAVASKQRAAKAPSGGASPDDETLLSGNEYAFMDLLHEVSQNNGRWTRERWKQMHVKQRCRDRGTEGV